MILIFFAFLIPYYELILNVSTTQGEDGMSILITCLFAFAGGLFWYLVTHAFKSKTNKILTIIFLFVTPLLFYIEFLIYRSYKVFYDVNTVINGAGGVVNGFMVDALRLVLNYEGISRLILFYAPLLLYIFVLKKKEEDEKYFGPVMAVGVSVIFALFFLLGRLMVNLSEPHKLMYGEEYSYHSVVENMGFGTGLRLDVFNIITGKSEKTDFDLSYTEVQEVKAVNTPSPVYDASKLIIGGIDETVTGLRDNDDDSALLPTPSPTPVEYGYNMYDLDFEALAETTSGTAKDLDLYVASLTPSKQNEFTGLFKGKNLIFISAEAFSGDVISEELTPTLYRLSHKGIQFEDFIQPAMAGTTGGEYSNLFGLLPTAGGKSIKEITTQKIFLNMGWQLDREGYYGKAYHDNTGTVYSRNTTHNLLGYSDGFEGTDGSVGEYVKAHGFPASDVELFQGSFEEYKDKQPFNIYYMSVSGHGQYGRSINNLSNKNYDVVKDLPYNEQVKCYFSNQLEFEYALEYLVGALEKKGIANDTVIVISPDHFPYGLDNDASLGNMPNLSDLYGYNVVNYLQRDHNRLIIWSGCLEDMDPIVVSSPTSSMDILPTLSNLFGVEFDSRLLPGRDVFSDAEAISFNGSYDWKTDLGTYIAAKNEFTPINDEVEIPEDYVKRIKSVVRNKYNFCKGVLSGNYYTHVYNALFGE